MLAEHVLEEAGWQRIGQAVGAEEVAGICGERRGDQVRIYGRQLVTATECLGDDAGPQVFIPSRSSVLSWRTPSGPTA